MKPLLVASAILALTGPALAQSDAPSPPPTQKKTFDEHDIMVLRHASEYTKTPAILQFEAALLPQYETHLRLAQRAQDAEARQG